MGEGVKDPVYVSEGVKEPVGVREGVSVKEAVPVTVAVVWMDAVGKMGLVVGVEIGNVPDVVGVRNSAVSLGT